MNENRMDFRARHVDAFAAKEPNPVGEEYSGVGMGASSLTVSDAAMLLLASFPNQPRSCHEEEDDTAHDGRLQTT